MKIGLNFLPAFLVCLFTCLLIGTKLYSKQKLVVTIHLYGVSESKISLIPLSGSKPFKPITEIPIVNNNSYTKITIDDKYLPSEFVLRYDYKENSSSVSYPAEQHLFINNQDLEIWVNPLHLNNEDSTYFQHNEIENTLFAAFNKESNNKKQQLNLLQTLLLNYDEPTSQLYKQCIIEYVNRKNIYNNWLIKQSQQYKDCFVSTLFKFQYVPEVVWSNNEADRIASMLNHYFDGIDFKDSMLLKTTDLIQFLDKYINIYGAMSSTVQLRDSLFTLAGRFAIEKAKKGNSYVYGWMVDYFYNGYETNSIFDGIKMLEPYLNDPLCFTQKRQSIIKRLTGLEQIKPDTFAPDFEIIDKEGRGEKFYNYKCNTRYKLVLFWSADCSHCKQLISKLYDWQQQLQNKNKLTIFALSLDNTDSEIAEWNLAIKQLPNWIHKRCIGGINSIEANSYFILSTPTMILINCKTNKIISLPETLIELEQEIK